MNQCPTCQGPLEGIEFAKRTRFAVWCPSCALVWEPVDVQPGQQEEEEVVEDPLSVVHIRELKAQVERAITKRTEKSGANR